MNALPPIAPAASAASNGLTPRRVQAALHFRRRHGKTFLSRQLTPHPFHMTRPFYFPDDPAGMATLYLQSSSGGLYGDDDLKLEIAVEDGASAQVTTQASTIVHAARGGLTRQTVTIDVGAGGYLEYLPDPLILFAGSAVSARVDVRAAPDACLMLSDSFLGHDPNGGAARFDRFENMIRIDRRDDDSADFIDRMRISGINWPAGAEGGALGRTGAFGCYGAFYLVNPPDLDAAVYRIRAAMPEGASAGETNSYVGVEALPSRHVVAARFLAQDGARLSALLSAAAESAREAVTGRVPVRRPK